MGQSESVGASESGSDNGTTITESDCTEWMREAQVHIVHTWSTMGYRSTWLECDYCAAIVLLDRQKAFRHRLIHTMQIQLNQLNVGHLIGDRLL